MEAKGIEAIIDLARDSAVPQVVARTAGGKIHLLVPGRGVHGNQIVVVDTALDAQPGRKSGDVSVFDIASLNALMAENTGGDISVYVDRDARAPAIVAILNGHGRGGPGWGDHRVSVQFRHTPQWKKWMEIDGKFLSQSEFANFIEDNLPDIRDPAPGDMLEISQFLEITRTTSFKSVTRPKSGVVQFKNESNDVSASSMELPDTITLFIAPLFGLPPMEVSARFRYRIADGGLKLGVKIQRREEIIAQILEEMVVEIALPPGAVIVEGVAPGAATRVAV